MCHLSETQHACKHFTRTVAHPCPAARFAAGISDRTNKRFLVACHNRQVSMAASSALPCNTCLARPGGGASGTTTSAAAAAAAANEARGNGEDERYKSFRFSQQQQNNHHQNHNQQQHKPEPIVFSSSTVQWYYANGSTMKTPDHFRDFGMSEEAQ